VNVLQDEILFTYDPKLLTPQQILEVIKKQGFQGTIVPDRPPEKSDN
jgi:hypothetical protein